ncbi:MAG: YggS family pyridoxal phosphate-dependent enzyme [bacterium]
MNSPASLALRQRLDQIASRIESARARRGGGPVYMLPVTKGQPGKMVAALLRLHVWAIGENRVQEARKKFPEIETALGPDWKLTERHLIGTLQTNKAREAVTLFDWIQSVDRLKLAEELQIQAAAVSRTINITLQIKYGSEPTKQGMSEETLLKDLPAYGQFPNLRVRGLMLIPPLDADRVVTRSYFRRMKQLFESVRLQASRLKLPWDTLSMGMSDDFEMAIEEGATMVRLGRLVFDGIPEDVEEPKIPLDIMDE